MLNTAPSRSLTRRSRNLLAVGFIVLSAGIFAFTIGAFFYLVPTFFGPGTSGEQIQNALGLILLVTGGGGALGGGGLIVRALTRRLENDLAYITGEHLKAYLDERYKFIRNINQPGLGYIDAVLIGPPGILVFRILERAGELLNEQGGWVRKNRDGDWTPMQVNPTKEAIVDIKAVREYMARYNLKDLDVYGVVVFTTEPPELIIELQEPVVPVAHLSGLLDALRDNYLARERMSEKRVERIANMLLGER